MVCVPRQSLGTRAMGAEGNGDEAVETRAMGNQALRRSEIFWV